MSLQTVHEMVYEWDDKERECHQLYVNERKSLDEVMQILAHRHNFNPSKRAFQTQFKRWDFPSKQNPAHKNDVLVERVHELWEANTSQKDMLRILNAEGHPIKERELMRVRAKNRWLLRVPNGTNTYGSCGYAKKRKRDEDAKFLTHGGDGADDMQEMERVVMEENAAAQARDDAETADIAKEASDGDLLPEIQEKRRLRLEKLQAESAERWATKKRRRRTRGWAGLPADPPGPPRFPSETTIDESKAYLNLDNEIYRQVRDQFQGICEQSGFTKKTQAGPENWQNAKERLIRESGHLHMVFHGPPSSVTIENKHLALDVVCTDVTKRMRTLERRMTIAEAKNALGINPEQSRDIRTQFYEILKADHFTSKLEAGDQHWSDLKQRWVAGSQLLIDIMSASEPNMRDRGQKVKAVEVLCRDVMKRLRDDQTKRDPSRRKQINAGPGPGPAPPKIPRLNQDLSVYASNVIMDQALQHRVQDNMAQQGQVQIDPSLLASASEPSLEVTLQLQKFAAEAAQDHHSYSGTNPFPPSAYQPAPIYFRLDPLSTLVEEPKVWVASLTSTSLVQLTESTQREHPQARNIRYAGIVMDHATGGETLYQIESDDDFRVYLTYVADRNGKPTISVHMTP